MILYDEIGRPKFYDEAYLLKFSLLVSSISRSDGFINAVNWAENLDGSNSRLAKKYAEETIENIKKLKKILPEGLKNRFEPNHIEKMCKKILEK